MPGHLPLLECGNSGGAGGGSAYAFLGQVVAAGDNGTVNQATNAGSASIASFK
jgi:hypothetical protein